MNETNVTSSEWNHKPQSFWKRDQKNRTRHHSYYFCFTLTFVRLVPTTAPNGWSRRPPEDEFPLRFLSHLFKRFPCDERGLRCASVCAEIITWLIRLCWMFTNIRSFVVCLQIKRKWYDLDLRCQVWLAPFTAHVRLEQASGDWHWA